MEQGYLPGQEQFPEEPVEEKPLITGAVLARQMLICLLIMAGLGVAGSFSRPTRLAGLTRRFYYAIRADQASTFGYLGRQPVIGALLDWFKDVFRATLTPQAQVGNSAGTEWFVPPVPGKIQRGFGWYTERNSPSFYPGVDLASSMGRPVRASREGVVQAVTQEAGGTWRVVLAHQGGWRTVYGNCARVNVSVGERVKTGQELAVAGRSAAGVHWEIWKDGQPVDPAKYVGQ